MSKPVMSVGEVTQDISELKRNWTLRNSRFGEWYDVLILTDKYSKAKMESFVSSDPRAFFNMCMYLMISGELRHFIPITGDSPTELDKQGKIERACQYMWSVVDRTRRAGGSDPFLWELCFQMIALGWYSWVIAYDEDNNVPILRGWSPAETFPRFEEDHMTSCVHSYRLSVIAAKRKAVMNKWTWNTTATQGTVSLDDYFILDEKDVLWNMILLDGQDTTGWVQRPDMKLFVAPVAGFPDKGSIKTASYDWQKFRGQSALEPSMKTWDALNKWMTFQMQILRDTAEPKWQEFVTGTSQLDPKKMRQRGATFSYGAQDKGILAIQPPALPLELRATLVDLVRELQKTGFSDLVFGMVESGQMPSGVSLGTLASSSANEVLAPYMDSKNYIIAEIDRFWLSKLKSKKRTFVIKGKKAEKLASTEIPDDVSVLAESDLATPKDWMERATVANMLEKHLDSATIQDQILKIPDIQEVKRRKARDLISDHPMAKNVELAAAFQTHAEYLMSRGDAVQAELFKQAADALKAQFGVPPAGSGSPAGATEAEAKRAAAAPAEKVGIAPQLGGMQLPTRNAGGG